MNEVTADFAVSVDPPLLKSKYNLYDPDGITMQQFDKVDDSDSHLQSGRQLSRRKWGPRFENPIRYAEREQL